MELVDWIPVDLLGDIIVELAGAAEVHREPENGFREIEVEFSDTVPVYHAVNPEFVMWADLLPTVRRSLGECGIKTVTWNEWVDALAQSQHSAADMTHNPGVKLLEFFKALKLGDGSTSMVPRLDTAHAEMKSGSLAGLKPVGSVWMEAWLKQWAF